MPDWPAWFPENCPPADARPATGLVYRIVEFDPPTGPDLLPSVLIVGHLRYGVKT